MIEDSPTGATADLSAGIQVIYHPQEPDPSPPDGAHSLAAGMALDPLIETFLNKKAPA